MIASFVHVRRATAFVAMALIACFASAALPERVEPMLTAAAEPGVGANAEPQLPPTPTPVSPLVAPQTVIIQEVVPPANPPINEDEQQVIALLADLQRYAIATAEELRRELVGAVQAMNRTRSEANRVRVAVLLTLPAAGPPDDARAQVLLESVVGKNPINTPMRQLAAVLDAQISERVRNVGEERKKTQQAQEKLDQLRAVERSLLLERSRNSGGAGGGGGGGGTGR